MTEKGRVKLCRDEVAPLQILLLLQTVLHVSSARRFRSATLATNSLVLPHLSGHLRIHGHGHSGFRTSREIQMNASSEDFDATEKLAKDIAAFKEAARAKAESEDKSMEEISAKLWKLTQATERKRVVSSSTDEAAEVSEFVMPSSFGSARRERKRYSTKKDDVPQKPSLRISSGDQYLSGVQDKLVEDLQKAFEERKAILGLEHPETLASLSELAAAFETLGRLKDLEVLQEAAVIDFTFSLGTLHPLTLTVMGNLSKTKLSHGSFAAAVALQSQVLRNTKLAFGIKHPTTWHCYSTFAEIYEATGDLEAAQDMQERATKWTMRILGRGHPDTQERLRKLTNILKLRGDWKGVLALLKPETSETLKAISEKAQQFREEGNWKAADDLASYVSSTRWRQRKNYFEKIKRSQEYSSDGRSDANSGKLTQQEPQDAKEKVGKSEESDKYEKDDMENEADSGDAKTEDQDDQFNENTTREPEEETRNIQPTEEVVAPEFIPEFDAFHMQSIIDMTAAKISESSLAEDLPDDIFAATTAELKQFYEDDGGNLYSRFQAKELMKLVSKRCAEVLVGCATKVKKGGGVSINNGEKACDNYTMESTTHDSPTMEPETMQPTDEDSASFDATPQFDATQMKAIIDMTATRIRESNTGQKIPDDVWLSTVAELKLLYEQEEEGTLYSRAQARNLMALTGEKCAEALSRIGSGEKTWDSHTIESTTSESATMEPEEVAGTMQPTDEDSASLDATPEFDATQMKAIIDMTATKILETSIGQKFTDDVLLSTVAELKLPYEQEEGTLYSRAQARKLMALTGEKCAQALSRSLRE